MNITTEQLANRQVAVVVQLDDEQVNKALQQAARKIGQRYVVPGYRKGKAPYAAVVRMVGKDALYEQVAEDMADATYRQMLEQSGLDPVAPGVMEDVTFEPFTYRFVLPLEPEVYLGDYRSVRVERTPVVVSDDEVDAELLKLQQEQTDWLPVADDAGAAYGDLLTISIAGHAGDEEIIEDSALDLVLEKDSVDLPPGLEAHLEGATVGSHLVVDITYPEDSPSDFAGQQAHFEIDVLSIKRKDLPKLDDSFAPLIGDFNTVDDLKAHLRQELIKNGQEEADELYLNTVVEEMLKVASIEYPPALVEDSANRLFESEKQRIRSFGIEMNDYLRIMQKTEASLRKELLGQAELRLQFDLMLAELIVAEKLKVEDAEIEDYAAKILDSTPDASDDMREFFQSDLGRRTIELELVQRQALKRIIAIGAGEAPDLPAEEPADPASSEAETQPAAA